MSLRDRLIDAGVDVSSPTDPYDDRSPQLVASPSTVQQLSDTMRAADLENATVGLRGNGTKLTWAAPAPAYDLVVRTGGLDQIVEHQPGDLIVIAQAGATLAAVNDLVAGDRQRLPIDEMIPGSTLGGLVATNVSGPTRLAAGTARDLLIGVTVVLADGTIAKAGGKVVKNVAGYDLGKLMTGSCGTLAAIAQTTFRLHPLPAATQWLAAQVPPDRLAAVLAATQHSQDVPTAIEIDCAPGGNPQVAVLLTGTEQGVAVRADRLGTAIGARGADDLPWPWQFPFPGDGSMPALKISCLLSAVPTVVTVAGELGWRLRGSAGVGVLYAAPTVPVDAAGVSDALARLRAVATGGSVVLLDGPRDLRDAVDLWGPVPALAMMRRVKDEFDPRHRLAPGRFVGAI